MAVEEQLEQAKKAVERQIKMALIQKSMTQAELAAKSGIERTALNKIEKGTRKVSSDELKAIALALNTSADMLLDLKDPELTWADLGMPYGGKIPEELKDTYADIARGYFKRHPEYLDKE